MDIAKRIRPRSMPDKSVRKLFCGIARNDLYLISPQHNMVNELIGK